MESFLDFSPLTITDEQFNAFHSIDRVIFTRLIVRLGRDVKESVQVMGFLLWLEQDHKKDLKIIERMLKLTYDLLNKTADETLFCIRLIEIEIIQPEHVSRELHLLQQVVKKPISLQSLHANRINVLSGVSRVINEVCVRAFRDIINYVENPIRNMMPFIVAEQAPVTHQSLVAEPSNPIGRPSVVIAQGPLAPVVQNQPEVEHASTRPFMIGSHEIRPQILPPLGFYPSVRFGGRLPQGFVEEDVSQDNRTIFLTFSKGYPISANEVMEFFTRRFGDFIESFHMQDVQGDGQPLYARVVAKSVAVVNRVVGGGRAKYRINGKHVCARKFIRNQRSPTGAASSE